MNWVYINEVFSILEKHFDAKTLTELRYNNNYQLLVAIMLSAQATDISVNKITEKLFQILKTPHDALHFGFNKIHQYTKNINYHNVKTKYILKMSEQLILHFNGKVPNNFDDLIKLAGVGRKTANLLLSIAFKQNRIAVDTHVFRVSNRLGIVKANNVVDTEKQLLENITSNKQQQINTLFVQFGRKYCKAIKPKCTICPLKKYCKKYNTN